MAGVDISPKITGKKRDQSTFRTLEEAKSYAQRLWTNRQIAGRGLQDLSEKENCRVNAPGSKSQESWLQLARNR